MTNTATTKMSETERQELARGLGRYHRRMGLSLDITVAAVTKNHPELDGRQVRVGWNRERARR